MRGKRMRADNARSSADDLTLGYFFIGAPIQVDA
jgi:hypothetical protein